MNTYSDLAARIGYACLGLAVLAGAGGLLWQAYAGTLFVPALPETFIRALQPDIWKAAGETLSVLVAALFRASIYGLPLGAALALFPLLGATALPALAVLRQLPFAALIPLFILWVGFAASEGSALPAIAMAVEIASGVAQGIKPVPIDAETDASSAQRIVDALQAAPAEVFAALRPAIRIGALLIIATECVVSKTGIGNLLMQASLAFDPPKAVAAALVMWVLMIAFDALLAGAQHISSAVRQESTR